MLVKGLSRKVDFARVIVSFVCRAASYVSDGYFTYHQRPKTNIAFKQAGSNSIAKNELCIVIQGLISDIDFTIATINLYRGNIFPGAQIVVSTWNTLPSSSLLLLEKLDVVLILSEMPPNYGRSNINLQILSSFRGVEYARANGYTYCLKTRADQRVNALGTFEFLRSILEIFPSSSRAQKGRIIGLSLNTFFRRMYGLSDMFVFGTTSDMFVFWSVKPDPRPSNFLVPECASGVDYAKLEVAEVFLTLNYLRRLGHQLSWTYRDSEECFRRYFVVLDTDSVDLYWNKYNVREHRWRNYTDQSGEYEELSFARWINIYNQME